MAPLNKALGNGVHVGSTTEPRMWRDLSDEGRDMYKATQGRMAKSESRMNLASAENDMF